MIPLLLAAALAGPPAPRDPAVVLLEARLEQVRKVADGTLADAAILGVAGAFDIWATERCVARNPSCYEANPLGKDSGTSRLALKAALYPVKVGGSYILRRKSHHGLARVYTIAVAAVDVALGVRALRLAGN